MEELNNANVIVDNEWPKMIKAVNLHYATWRVHAPQ